MVEISEIFATSSQNSLLQLHVSKKVFFQKFGTCTRNGSLGAFLVKTIL